jgi:flavin-dependent dehydrogenase
LISTYLRLPEKPYVETLFAVYTEQTDVLVIGAGPAGTVAASLVHQAGYRVKVVEKQKFPRFVIGESLLPRCMEALEAAGFLEAVKQQGFQEKFGAKFVRDGKVCDYIFSDAFTPGWTWTWQVPRGNFDKTLADTLAGMGVPVEYETGVTGIVFNGSNSVTTVEMPDGASKQIEARFIIDGSGYGRVIPRLFNLDRPSSLPPRKTLFAHAQDPNRFSDGEPNRITIIVHEPTTWIWVIPFSSGVTSVGYVGDPEFFQKYAGTPDQQLRAMIEAEPHIRERFRDAEFLFEPRTIEGWSTTTDKFYGEGFVLTGNVTEFLDPVFSSGVTLAVASSQRAGELVVRTLNGEAVDWDRDYMQYMMQGVDTFRSYVNSWYDGTLGTIFFAERQDPEIKRQICSVLAGYVWDLDNPYVNNPDANLKRLERLIKLEHAIHQ